MEDLLKLKNYNKYIEQIKEGLILLPDKILSGLIGDVKHIENEKPYMKIGETHEVELNAKKVQITSRGSLRTIAIDGIHFDSAEQAACNMYDPYDEFINLDLSYSHIQRDSEFAKTVLDFTFIPIIDIDHDEIRYTISKYSKGLKKYFDPHKVVKAVYAVDNILFYVKTNFGKLKKYYFQIGSINAKDLMPYICKATAMKNGINSDLYLAFFIHQDDLPFTVGACKEDFYALKDILNKVSFKGTTPLKYMIFEELKQKGKLNLKQKEAIAYNYAMLLTNKTKSQLCNQLGVTLDDYDSLMDETKHPSVDKHKVSKMLNIIDNIHELKYYETLNLIWKVKYNDIPGTL